MSLLITGFPGFIAGRLLSRLIADRPADTRFFLLVQPQFVFVARRRCQELEAAHPRFAGRWHLVEGDITAPDLGMTAAAVDAVKEHVSEVWHLAALYDLTAAAAPSYRINVDGTVHVLDLCAKLPHLASLQYVSTCYVAGDRTGWVYEDELDLGQGFKNHYESTKCWAEKHVRHRMADLPTAIYRPSIVVGDSVTGETAKGDGPYYVLRFLMRLPRRVPMVHLGPTAAKANLVPVDYVVDAMARLSADPRALGKTFQLADPDPLSGAEVMEAFVDELGRAPVIATLPQRLADALIERRRVRLAMGIPRQSFDYFSHDVRFDVSNTRALLASQRPPCPRFPDYLPVLIDYARNNPSIFQEVHA